MVQPLAITVMMGKSNTCAPKYLTHITKMKFKYIRSPLMREGTRARFFPQANFEPGAAACLTSSAFLDLCPWPSRGRAASVAWAWRGASSASWPAAASSPSAGRASCCGGRRRARRPPRRCWTRPRIPPLRRSSPRRSTRPPSCLSSLSGRRPCWGPRT